MRFFNIVPNLYICLTMSDLSTQIWVYKSDKSQTLFLFKYIHFFLQIIKRTFYLWNTFLIFRSINSTTIFWESKKKLGTTNYNLRTQKYKLRTTNYNLRTQMKKLRTWNYKLWTQMKKLRTWNYKLWTQMKKLRTWNYKLWTQKHRIIKTKASLWRLGFKKTLN